jgi:hypothetical protein
MYYQVQVTITQTTKSGGEKKNNEQYLVSAVSVGDAEKQIHEKFTGVTLDWEVTKVTQSKIIEVLEPGIEN